MQGPPAVRRLFELTGTLDRLSFVEPAAAAPRLDRLSGVSQPAGYRGGRPHPADACLPYVTFGTWGGSYAP